MRAIGAFIFAGGFTLGVKEYFDVECVLEEGPYGVATMRHNQPEIPVHVGFERWPVEHLRDAGIVDLIYGNCPCAAWSSAGSSVVQGADWRVDPRVDCTRRFFSLLERLQPRAWAWESVVNAFTKGREFVDELTQRAVALGYSVTYLLHDAAYLGVPQRRLRFFMVATKVRFDIEDHFSSVKTAEEALRGLNDPGEPLDHNIRKYRYLLPTMPAGHNLRQAWEKFHPKPWPLNQRGQVVGRPCMTIRRVHRGRPSPVVMHELVHPTEDRGLSLKELALLCGYPATYEFIKARDAGQIGRGVCPPVGAWLAKNVRRCLERGEVEATPTVKIIDARQPPIVVTVLPTGAVAVSAVSATSAHEPPDQGGDAAHVVARVLTPFPLAEDLDMAQRGRPPGSGTGPTGLGVGAYLRALIQLRAWTDDQLLSAVQHYYPGSRATLGDVRWNRTKLVKELSVSSHQLHPEGPVSSALPPPPSEVLRSAEVG